jgi:hypothetical protein
MGIAARGGRSAVPHPHAAIRGTVAAPYFSRSLRIPGARRDAGLSDASPERDESTHAWGAPGPSALPLQTDKKQR